jgi:hypothetical protein
MADEPLVIAKGLTRTYPLGSGEVVGVVDVDLSIPQGHLVVLKGNSGAGRAPSSPSWADSTVPPAGSWWCQGGTSRNRPLRN